MSDHEAAAEEKTYPLKHSAAFAGGTFLATLPFEVFGHLGPTGLLVGGLASYVAWKHGPELYEQVRGMFPSPAVSQPSESSSEQLTSGTHSRSLWQRALGQFPEQQASPKEGEGEDLLASSIETVASTTEEEALFTTPLASETGGIARLTIEQIVAHCTPNSYKVFIGRSLTKAGHPAVLISLYKQHFRFMGASQRGKSSMVAAFLDIVTRTHDPKHVRLALLDKEDQTSHLFAHLPHVATVRGPDGTPLKLHARTCEQVLDHLTYVVAIMEYRYTMSKEQVMAQPLLLVYIEEFLALKNYFKMRVERAKGEQAKEQARGDYATLVYCIESLSQQGLKARVQLLLCAQVEYADDDFKEALVNVGCGFSFCVRPTAAAAAGFRNSDLVKRNAKDNKIGQAVVETPDCNDLVLAPDYDLEARLLAFERAHPELHPMHVSPQEGLVEHRNETMNGVNVNTVNIVNQPEKPVNAGVNASEYSPIPEKVPSTFTQAEEVQVILAQAELLKAGKPVTRTGIRDYLGWDNKQYQRVIKPVCDKHGIAM